MAIPCLILGSPKQLGNQKLKNSSKTRVVSSREDSPIEAFIQETQAAYIIFREATTVTTYSARLPGSHATFSRRESRSIQDALTNSNTRDYVIRDYKLYLKQELKSSPQTVNAYLTAIDSFYIFLGLGKAKAKRKDLPNFAPQALTQKEQKDFLRAIEDCKSIR